MAGKEITQHEVCDHSTGGGILLLWCPRCYYPELPRLPSDHIASPIESSLRLEAVELTWEDDQIDPFSYDLTSSRPLSAVTPQNPRKGWKEEKMTHRETPESQIPPLSVAFHFPL